MSRRLIIYLSIFSGLWLGFTMYAGAQKHAHVSSGPPTDVINFVQRTFFDTNSIGSLVTGGACNAPDSPSDAVSDTIPSPPAGPFQNIAEALTALSKVDPRISWSRGPDGIIRVRDGQVHDGLLHLRVRHLHFNDRAEPAFAIKDILSTPEVRAYLRDKNTVEGVYVRMGDLGILPGTTKGLPRLSDTMRDVTVEQALDRVAAFYRRLWIYSYCQSGPRRVVVITAQ